jgi:glycosyltransferase involved in cell wall biosynthesis
MEQLSRDFVQRHALKNTEFVGRLEPAELSDMIGNARFLVMPSEGYYETFGMVIIEAYARGVPVVASNIGVVPELVSDGQTGLLFEPGNATDLADKARWLWDHSVETQAMGEAGRRFCEERYTADACYQILIGVYEGLIDSK